MSSSCELSSFEVSSSEVVFQAVASEEEFADVTADVVSEQKFATWVLISKFDHVENKIVKDDELPSICDMLIELMLSHGIFRHFEWNLRAQVYLVSDLECQQQNEEERS